MHADVNWEHAAHLVRRTALAEGIAAPAVNPVLDDKDGPMVKSNTVLSLLDCRGVKPADSWLLVCDDNAGVESLSRAANDRSEFPVKGFETLGHCMGTAGRTKNSGMRCALPHVRQTGEHHASQATCHSVHGAMARRPPAIALTLPINDGCATWREVSQQAVAVP